MVREEGLIQGCLFPAMEAEGYRSTVLPLWGMRKRGKKGDRCLRVQMGQKAGKI